MRTDTTADGTQIKILGFPATRLDTARTQLAQAHARLARGAARSGQTVPAAPVIVVTREYAELRCGTCKRLGPEAGSWRNAPEGSLAREWGDCGPCDPLGMGTGCQGHMVVRDVVDLTVDTARPALAGWEFLAVVEPLQGGNLVRQVPGAAIAEGELDGWRTGEIACDHCAARRQRKETFIVRATGEDTAVAAGTHRQVGRQCLADFLGGASPAHVIFLLGVEKMIRWCGDEDGEGGGGWGGGPSTFDPDDFLGWTAAAVRLDGWTSKGAAREDEGRKATATTVSYLLTPQTGLGAASWQKARAEYRPTDADRAKGAAALAWAQGLPGASDYEKNLSLVAKQPRLAPKHAGILASAIAGYERELGRQVERARIASAPSNHIGEVGKRLDLELTVERVADIETNYGTLHIHTMRDGAGNALVWKTTSKRLDVGWSGKVRGTVKAHAEYRGEKQTELARCAL